MYTFVLHARTRTHTHTPTHTRDKHVLLRIRTCIVIFHYCCHDVATSSRSSWPDLTQSSLFCNFSDFLRTANSCSLSYSALKYAQKGRRIGKNPKLELISRRFQESVESKANFRNFADFYYDFSSAEEANSSPTRKEMSRDKVFGTLIWYDTYLICDWSISFLIQFLSTFCCQELDIDDDNCVILKKKKKRKEDKNDGRLWLESKFSHTQIHSHTYIHT